MKNLIAAVIGVALAAALYMGAAAAGIVNNPFS